MTLHWRLKSLCVRVYLKALKLSGRTVVLGPWRSELGFEQLYWLPFLTWAVKYAGLPPERCLAVSRGGMGAFYPASAHVDLYTLRGVDAVRLENVVDHEANGLQKQVKRTKWDDDVCRDAVDKAHGKGAKFFVLHPSWMYWLFDDFWENRETYHVVAKHTELSKMAVPPLPEGFELPQTFLAVRFYERHTFPFGVDVSNYAASIVKSLATHIPVVLLNQNLCADDHTDLPIQSANVFTLPAVPPEQNFILQAAVIARCAGFVGTYGGVAQWALRYGKPVISFYTDFGGTAQAHRTLSNMLSAAMGIPFECSSLKALKLWSMCLTRGNVEPTTPPAMASSQGDGHP